MKTAHMVLFAGATLAALLTSGARAQTAPDPGEVGVDERLGESVPLGLTLVDEAGQKVTLGSLIDRPTILTLNYFRCAGLCTPLLQGVADMLDHIPLDPTRDFRVLTVSFDERDTPEMAARKRENLLKTMKRPVPLATWRFLTGDAASTKALTDSVGFKFMRDGDTFTHTGVIIVLTPQGRISRYMHGTRFLPADVQMALNDSAQGAVRPTIAKFVQFCISYAPKGRRTAFNLMRAMGLVTLIALGVFMAAVLKKRPDPPNGGGRA